MRNRDYIAMNVYWFGLSFMWNGLHPIVLPTLLLGFVPESLKNTYLGGMTFAGLIIAMAVQPLAGALSDRTRSRWGRRRPWILAGTLCSLAFLAGMGLSGSFWMLLVAYLLLQLASNTAHGPAQGFIPDLVPSEQRGLASGLKNLFEMAGLVVTSLVAGRLMGQGSLTLPFAIIGAVLAASAAVTLLGTPEPPVTGAERPAGSKDPSSLLRVDLKGHADYGWLIASRFLILTGVYAVQGFALYYIRDWLGQPDAAAVTGNLMAAIGVALVLLVFPAGLLSDRVGRRRLNLVAGAMASAGILMLVLVKSVVSLYAFGAVIGMATGIFLSVNWALATDLIPPQEAGKYLGLSNLATAGAGAASRLGGPLIDGVNALQPGAYWGYPLLFVLASASTLVGTLLLLRIGSGTRRAARPH